MRRLVLVGGGHANIEVLRQFGMAPVAGCEVMLLSAPPHTAYSGMLPGLIAGHYAWQEAHIDLRPLAERAGARYSFVRAVGLDLERCIVRCADGAEVAYDWLGLDIGSTPNTAPIEHADAIGLPVRPVERLLAGVDGLLGEAAQKNLHVVVIGGGAGGIELCLALHHRLRLDAVERAARFTVVTLSEQILPGYPNGARARLQRILDERGVGMRTRTKVVSAQSDGIVLDSGEQVHADRVVWATGPAAAAWPSASGLRCDADGFVLVDRHLRSISHPHVFAAGDMATVADHPHPKSGVYAVRHGAVLAQNLRRALRGDRLLRFEPQKRALQLISTGDRCAVAAWDRWSLEGSTVWRWKDWIDRRFMARYR